MKISKIAAIVTTVLSGPALAQTYISDVANLIEQMPPSRSVPRAEGPTLDYSIRLAKAVSDECVAQGGRASVLVTDSVGEAVVVLSGDGAGVRAQVINITKAIAALKYRMSSGEVQDKAAVDPQLAAEIRANPNIGTVRRGAFLLMDGDRLIGAIAVSGMGSGEANEVCAQAGIAKAAQ